MSKDLKIEVINKDIIKLFSKDFIKNGIFDTKLKNINSKIFKMLDSVYDSNDVSILEMLDNYGYDISTLKITCNKKKKGTVITERKINNI